MVQLWKTFSLSILEQPFAVWGNAYGLTAKNEADLERNHKTFCKMVLGENFKSYFEALKTLNIQALKIRRKNLTLRFAQHSLADGKLMELFPLKRKQHTMDTHRKVKFQVFRAHTERYRNSPILTMQRLLNEVVCFNNCFTLSPKKQ